MQPLSSPLVVAPALNERVLDLVSVNVIQRVNRLSSDISITTKMIRI